MASSENGIPIRYEDLDTDPYLFNLLNGTFDLRTKTFRPHDPRDMLTKVANVQYDKDADCPLFKEFMDMITDGRTELAE